MTKSSLPVPSQNLKKACTQNFLKSITNLVHGYKKLTQLSF